jgi:hypothetical protein
MPEVSALRAGPGDVSRTNPHQAHFLLESQFHNVCNAQRHQVIASAMRLSQD